VGKASHAVTDSVDSTKKSLRDEATPEATRAKLDAMAEQTLERLFTEQPDSRPLFEESAGYAVFDAREASFYVVAGYGRGVAVDRNTDSRIYMKMATTGAGLSFGIGGWESQLIIVFESAADFEAFGKQGLDATAEAGTMVGDDKDQLSHRFNEGKAYYLLTKKGWKIGAKLTGSRYWPDDELN
jgi:lipid-binding SYLF domain-containing protein